MQSPHRATITLNGWQGLTTQEVEVVGSTPQRYRIRAITRTRLAGRQRYLEAGQTVLVPRKVVTFLDIPALEVAP
jgi:hypothetical protein